MKIQIQINIYFGKTFLQNRKAAYLFILVNKKKIK